MSRAGEQGLGTEAVRGPVTSPWSCMSPWVSLAPREEEKLPSRPPSLKVSNSMQYFKAFTGTEDKVNRKWNPSSLSPWLLIVGLAVTAKVLPL